MLAFSSRTLKHTTIDLQPKDLALVQKILLSSVPACTVWAFGSRVLGTAKLTSDLDIAVLGLPESQPQLIGTLQEAFAESRLPIKVDALDWNQTSESFRKIIEKQKVVLHEAEAV